MNTLTLGDAVAIAEVISWAQHNARLAYLDDRGDVAYGTARSIGDDRGMFLAAGDDVRDGFLRITTAMGWEWFVPMVDAVERQRAGTMVRDAVQS